MMRYVLLFSYMPLAGAMIFACSPLRHAAGHVLLLAMPLPFMPPLLPLRATPLLRRLRAD